MIMLSMQLRPRQKQVTSWIRFQGGAGLVAPLWERLMDSLLELTSAWRLIFMKLCVRKRSVTDDE